MKSLTEVTEELKESREQIARIEQDIPKETDVDKAKDLSRQVRRLRTRVEALEWVLGYRGA